MNAVFRTEDLAKRFGRVTAVLATASTLIPTPDH